jgi:MoaA/NifB/PqqE/SkfB family radical SAM enzyme
LAEKELSCAEIRRVFTESELLRHLSEIVLTGGEPTLRPDFPEILEFLAEALPDTHLRITTNAVASEGVLASLLPLAKTGSLKRCTLVISINGLQKTHDELRGVPGSFVSAVGMLEAAPRHLPGLRREVTFMVCPDNSEQIGAVYGLAVEHGAGFSMCVAQDSDILFANRGRVRWEAGAISRARQAIQEMTARLLGGRCEHGNMVCPEERFYYEHMTDYMRRPRRLIECPAGTLSLFVNPYGNVHPCVKLPFEMGTVRQMGFDDLWSGDRAGKVRSFIEAGYCHCWLLGEVRQYRPDSRVTPVR